MTTDEIGVLFGKTGTCIRLLAKKSGIVRDYDRRDYELNDGRFSDKWTPEHSYWLGFLHADGHCSKSSYQISLELREQDAYIVDGFREFVGLTKPVVHLPPHEFLSLNGKKLYTSSGTAIVAFNSKKMHADLTERGIISHNKAIWVPPVGVRDYMRGMFDGNGSIIKMKRIGQWEWYYTGGLPACMFFYDKWKSLGINLPEPKKKPGCWQLRIRGKGVMTAQAFMYEGNTGPQLHRKAVFTPSEHLWDSSGYVAPKAYATEYDKARNRFRVRPTYNGRTVDLGRHRTKGLAWLAYAKFSLRVNGKKSPFYRVR